MERMWMVRGASGRLFDDFREQNAVALGWHELADVAKPGVSEDEIASVYVKRRPEYGIATGKRVLGRSPLRIPNCARAATSGASWNRAGPPRRRDSVGVRPGRVHAQRGCAGEGDGHERDLQDRGPAVVR